MKLSSVCGFSVLAMLACSLAQADFVPYTDPVGQAGTQGYTDSLGMDFVVNAPNLQVTQLGVFDDGGNGITGTLNVQLYAVTDVDNNPNTMSDDLGVAISPVLSFTGNAGTLVDWERLMPLATPIALAVGQRYSIVSWGYSANDLNGNHSTGTPNTAPAVDDGGGAISFVGLSRWGGPAGSFPANGDSDGTRYEAGTLVIGTVPEPATFTLAALSALALVGLMARRRK